MRVRGVLWDVGNVIVRWDPRNLYDQVIEEPARRAWFLSHVCTMDWHSQIDAGKPFAQAVAELAVAHPQWAEQIGFWQRRFLEMISGPIPETEAVIAELAGEGAPQFGLTNMSVEVWDPIRAMSPAFAHLSLTVVAGAEGVIKPDPAIFAIACGRAGLEPGELLFVDDSPANIAAAADLGFAVHRFEDSADLRPALVRHGLLAPVDR